MKTTKGIIGEASLLRHNKALKALPLVAAIALTEKDAIQRIRLISERHILSAGKARTAFSI